MNEPTPRQLAGFLRRLLRRGAVILIDPRQRTPIPAGVELDGEQVQIVPAAPPFAQSAEDEDSRWPLVLARLRASLSLSEAEELAAAIELEHARRKALAPFDQSAPSRSYIPHNT